VKATTRAHAFQFQTPATPGTGASRKGLNVAVQIVGARITPWPGQPLRTIQLVHDVKRHPNSQPNERYTVSVADYQGTGTAFSVFFAVQGTGGENYGGPAPCRDTTRAEVDGIVCASKDAIAPGVRRD
jgi:hypothetical protein